MFSELNLYKHKNNTDVAFSPIYVVEHEHGYSIKCYWFNVTNLNKIFLCTDRWDVIFIKKEQGQPGQR